MAAWDALDNAQEKAIRRADGRSACSVESADQWCERAGADRAIDILLGGFGPLNGQNAKGIELQTLMWSGTADAKLVVSKRELLTDLPSPTWIARDGDMLYAVLENTSEVASLRIVRNDKGGNDAGYCCNDEHYDNGQACGEYGDAKPRAAGLSRDGQHGDGRGGNVRDRHVRLEQTSRVRVQGDGPTHAAVAIDDEGHRHLIVANYGDGSLCVHRLDEQGRILPGNQLLQGEGHGPLPAQDGPHAHWVLPLPDGRVLTTDLGADRIYVHRWEHGALRRSGEVRLAPGTGPRDMHLMPTNGRGWRVAVVNEWGCSVTVLAGGETMPSVGPSAAPQPQPQPNESGALDRLLGNDGVQAVQTTSLGGDDIDQAASLAYVPFELLGGKMRSDRDSGHGSAVRIGRSAQPDDSARRDDAVLPESNVHRNTAVQKDGDSHCGENVRMDERLTDGCGIVYIGLRGSDRVVALSWDGERFARLADPGVKDWRGRGTACGGSRPRQLVAWGTLLLAADEASNNLAAFDLSGTFEPRLIAQLEADSPTVILQI
ncbi:MAG: lactonase family protein [Bifidobacterium sp.]|nr:lactonase family protein [Bifidobacterium sp.]